MNVQLDDAAERLRIQTALDETLFVEAAAGTGKTAALVGRIVEVLRTGRAELERIVALTFTDKAAGEIKLRLQAQIETARQTSSDDEKARFEKALEQLEVAHIGTIHSFCADLLREHPVEAGVDPVFKIAADDEARGLLARVLDRWFQRVLLDPPQGVRRLIRRRKARPDRGGTREALLEAAFTLAERRDYTAKWTRPEFDRTAAIDRLTIDLAALADFSGKAEKKRSRLAEAFGSIAAFVRETERQEAVSDRDYDGLEARLVELAKERFWTYQGFGEMYGSGHRRDDVLAQRDRVSGELERFREQADADLSVCIREDLQQVLAEYETGKYREGRVDFLDLLIRARQIVRDNAKLRRKLQVRYTHFFVDEFQDTDPLQAEILLLLSANDAQETHYRNVTPEPGKLFLVGDPKQSIYRFRRADVRLYEQIREQLLGSGAVHVKLTTSFRSVPGIQSAVNASFEPVMQRADDGAQADYVELARYRKAIADQPSVIALPVPEPYGSYGRMTRSAMEASYPTAVAAFIHWLLRDSGWQISQPGSGETTRGIEERDICILFRRFRSYFRDVAAPYARALESRDIPHVLVGGHSFLEREEVLGVRNVLMAIEWPDDALNVYATLRGPFYGFNDETLFLFREATGSLHPLQPAQDRLEPHLQPVADALQELRGFHHGRNRKPLASTIHDFLRTVRAHASLAVWPNGDQALRNCLHLAEMARSFERRGMSFRAFVEYLDERSGSGGGAEAPLLEAGTQGIRVMTVHRAKGLEFPVVILADPACSRTGAMPSYTIDEEKGLWAGPLCGLAPHDLRLNLKEEKRREEEEAVRVAYVAATRARDLLVAPAVGDSAEWECWTDVLSPAIYPAMGQWKQSGPAPGCPSSFGNDSVATRPDRCENGPDNSVAPGLHAPSRGDHDVVWWDPRALELDVPESLPVPYRELLQEVEGEEEEGGRQDYETWKESKTNLLASGEKPSTIVKTVTALVEDRLNVGDEEAAIQILVLGRERRSGGKRFGALVHNTLATIQLEAVEADVRAAVEAAARETGSDQAEQAAAMRCVQAVLAHPLLERARTASDVRREVPVLMQQAGAIVEGRVDLAFLELFDGSMQWTVVDFKTHGEIEGKTAAFERQLRLYVRGIREATGQAAEGVLMAV